MPGAEYLTVEEAMSQSGVSRSTIYQWLKEGRLRFDRLGRPRRIRRDDLEKLLRPIGLTPQQARTALITSHEHLLRDSFHFLERNPPPLDSIGRYVPYAIFGYLLRLGRALHLLVTHDYVEEAKPIARTMVGTALNIVAIVDGNVDGRAEADGRALQYVTYQRRLRRRGLQRLVDHNFLTPERREAIDAADTDEEEKVLAGYKSAGIEPIKLGTRTDTWSGLNDYELAVKMKAKHWYDLYYGPFSDLGAHGNIGSVSSQIAGMLAGEFIVGPIGAEPAILAHLLMASVESIGQCLEQLDQHYGLGRNAEVLELRRAAWQAVEDYVRWRAEAK